MQMQKHACLHARTNQIKQTHVFLPQVFGPAYDNALLTDIADCL